MRCFAKRVLVAGLAVMICALMVSEAGARPRPRPRVWRKPAAPAARKYKYVKKHDLNGDGAVDARDRLMWANRYKNKETAIIIDSENADIYEAMDIDNDGKVTKSEITVFYTEYDLNKNGVLDEKEIEEAAD